jgi:hypothetical protein
MKLVDFNFGFRCMGILGFRYMSQHSMRLCISLFFVFAITLGGENLRFILLGGVRFSTPESLYRGRTFFPRMTTLVLQTQSYLLLRQV